jgi:hypothetical protein
MPRRASRAELERRVRDLAETFGWRHHRTRHPGLTRLGYPDGFPSDTLVRGGRLIFVSIAGAGGTLTPAESRWVEELRQVRSVEAHALDRDDAGSVARLLAARETQR